MNVADGRRMPRVRLVPAGSPVPRQWDGPAAALFPGDGRLDLEGSPWAVLGGPGTGKTSLLTDLAIAHVAAGTPADGVLFIAPSKESAGRIRDDLAARLPEEAAGAGGMVRAVHSLAFALVRESRVRRGEPEPQLMPGARQDSWIQTLLEGENEDDVEEWPDRLRPAVGMRGFARQVRDLILRAQERGLGAVELTELGESERVPEWTAVGRFLNRYQQAVRLTHNNDLNAAELVSAALAEIDRDPGLIERLAVEVLLVDDAEHLDPQSARLLTAVSDRARVTVVSGDQDQSVLGFRGATDDYLESIATNGRTVLLRRSLRCDGDVLRAVAGVADRLPGLREHRNPIGRHRSEMEDGEGEKRASLSVEVFSTGTAERAAVADFLRRAHVVDGVPWGEMAVLLRSGAADSPLHRSLARAGVPVQVDPTDVILSEQRLVSALVLAMRAITEPLEESEWEAVLTGPFGDADPVTMTRLMRGVRRAEPRTRAIERIIALLSAVRLDEDDEDLLSRLGQRERMVLERPLEVLAAGRKAIPEGVEMVLWAMWEASGLADHLMAESLRGGAAGSSADRDLDAVMTLFDFAGDLVEQAPMMSVPTFIGKVREQELPTGARDRRGVRRDAVSVISAHASLGRTFRAVAVAGVQEDVWPSTSPTGTVVRQQELIDLLDRNIAPGIPVSHTTARLAEERRLFYVAVTRSSGSVLVTAVDAPDDEGEPSRFLGELNAEAVAVTDAAEDTAASVEQISEIPELPATRDLAPRVLSDGPLVAELRAASLDPTAGESRRRRAAAQLERMAAAGFPGADPDSWWGLEEQSTDDPVKEGTLNVSPSTVDRMLQCQLRTMLEQSSRGDALVLGSTFHRAAQALDEGVGYADVEEELRSVLPRLLDEPAWRMPVIQEEWAEALESWWSWAQAQTVIGTEVPVEVMVADGVTVRGRMDRLQTDADGRYVIIDIKTGASAPSAEETDGNAQLKTYQLALSKGRVLTEASGTVRIVSDADGDGLPLGGAHLVFPRDRLSAGAPKTREQSGQTPEMLEEWRETVYAAAEGSRGPTALATPGTWCDNCMVRLACPTTKGMM